LLDSQPDRELISKAEREANGYLQVMTPLPAHEGWFVKTLVENIALNWIAVSPASTRSAVCRFG
jgi:hypothetical protein